VIYNLLKNRHLGYLSIYSFFKIESIYPVKRTLEVKTSGFEGKLAKLHLRLLIAPPIFLGLIRPHLRFEVGIGLGGSSPIGPFLCVTGEALNP